MRRSHRLLVTGAATAAATGTILLLTYAGPHAAGPLARLLDQIGAGVGMAESAVVHRFRGDGRATELAWFAPYRRDVAMLRAPGRVLIGAHDGNMPGTLAGAVAFEQRLGTNFPLLHFYAAWGDKPEQQFPERMVRAIHDLGSVPVITWEPWLVDFGARLHPDLPPAAERDKHGLAAVAAGDYDVYIDRWAADAAAFGQPILLRFAHEMNDPYRYPWGPQNNEPAEFIAAWRHVVQRFRDAGADNVLWIWSPHIAYEGYWQFYPGNDAVDWIATGVLNYGNVAYWSRWWSFGEIFEKKYAELNAVGKPIMIAEFGTLAIGGDAAAWYRDALTDLPTRLPNVHALLFFNVRGDATVTYQALDWTFSGDSALTAVVRDAISSWTPPRPTSSQR
jgi:hypothetical protein